MKKIRPITPEQWNGVCEFNKNIMQAFLSDATELSAATKKSYESNLKVWFIWVLENLGNKSMLDVKPLEYKRFQNWMVNRGCSSADIFNKRSAISSLNNYVEVYYGADFPLFRSFVNKSIKRPQKRDLNEKIPLTKAEFNRMIEVLENREEWQKAAYLKFTLETGCRRSESRQLLKDVINAEPVIKEKDGKKIVFYQAHPVRCKGFGTDGKVRRFAFSQSTMNALKKWIHARGEDNSPYMFVNKTGGRAQQVSETCFNSWAANDFTRILGRRFHPHLLRTSRACQLSEDGVDIEKIKKLLGHESSVTTQNCYIIRKDSDDLDDLYIIQ